MCSESIDLKGDIPVNCVTQSKEAFEAMLIKYFETSAHEVLSRMV